MLRSMTGYTEVRCRHKDNLLNLEMRSLNHRFLECVVHLPDGLGQAEDMIKNMVHSKLDRGRVTVVLSLTSLRPKIFVNNALAKSYVNALKQLNKKLKLENNLSISQIINTPGILNLEKPQVTQELLKVIKNMLGGALKKMIYIRQKEGRALACDITSRINSIKEEAVKIRAFTSATIKEKEKDLPDEEYGMFLKSTDVSEEMTRIAYHVKNFLITLRRSESVGKELDFITQEIQREANTISSKAQDARVSSSVIKIKSAVDKIREQLQNAE